MTPNLHWQPYKIAKEMGIKHQVKQTLLKIITDIKALNEAERDTYFMALMDHVFIDNNPSFIPIAHPELLEMIKPFLLKHIDTNMGLIWAFRCLNFRGMIPLIEKSTGIKYINGNELLYKVLENENTNTEERKISTKLLIQEHFNSIDYALHELPHGLLIDLEICIKVLNEIKELNQSLSSDEQILHSNYNINIDHYEFLLQKWVLFTNKSFHLIDDIEKKWHLWDTITIPDF